MRRILLTLPLLLLATAASAANPYFLDRNGVLWSGTSQPEGLVLTATKDDEALVRTVVPFELGLAGTSDTQIQVAADDLTGKVVVVWQRNWTADLSEIMLAVWNDGTWERIVHLTDDITSHGRNPVIQLSEVSTLEPGTDGGSDVSISDSFLNVLWWEGVDDPHGNYASLCLTALPADPSSLMTQNLEIYTPVGLSCDAPAPVDVVEHPLFASQTERDSALMLFASQRNCLLHLVQVRFVLTPESPPANSGITVTAQRRRHMPIFGVRKTMVTSIDLSMGGARLILGKNLNPVVYRVVGNRVEYVTAADSGWSPRRTLTVKNGLTMDQAIPLVENLAR
jgi:hypothetical protein